MECPECNNELNELDIAEAVLYSFRGMSATFSTSCPHCDEFLYLEYNLNNIH